MLAAACEGILQSKPGGEGLTAEDERRRSLRQNVSWPVNIVVGEERVSGETVDISLDGLHVNCDDPVPLYEIVTMTISPPDKSPINVTVRVVWSALDGIDTENRAVGMGLCFVEISDEDRLYFESTLSEQME